MESSTKPLWGVRDVAEYLGVPENTIYRWRHHNYGPPGKRVGRFVRFDPEEVRAWFANQPDDSA